MSEKYMEMFKKNLYELRTKEGISQKQLGEILGQTIDSAQARISKLENGSIKPNLTELIRIAEHFHVSLDWLLGRKEVPQTTKITPKSICEFLANAQKYNLHIAEISATETCFTTFWDFDSTEPRFAPEEKNNTYNAIYFSKWLPVPNNPFSEDYMEFEQIGNGYEAGRLINQFLERLRKINQMKKEGNLDDEMYGLLLNSYLDKIPDK